jgi:hypothetical protein
MRVLEARAVKCGPRWRVELLGIGLAVEIHSLETLDDEVVPVAARLLRLPPAEVQVDVRWYLAEADVRLRQERSSAHARSRHEAEERARTAAARAKSLADQRTALETGHHADARSVDAAREDVQLARQRAARARRRAGDAEVREGTVRGATGQRSGLPD